MQHLQLTSLDRRKVQQPTLRTKLRIQITKWSIQFRYSRSWVLALALLTIKYSQRRRYYRVGRLGDSTVRHNQIINTRSRRERQAHSSCIA